jgi:hypothetical protein
VAAVAEDTILKTVTFDEHRLLSVNKNGLEYVDDQGCRCAIDFHACCESFNKGAAERLGARNPRYVGSRNILANPPEMILATDPPTRFLFPKPRVCGNGPGEESASPELRDWDKFQLRLYREGGVRTVDMT